ncbi:hypothetical protein, partial [Psychrobacter sp. Rd 27.2]|uniref:hypothetical protein n=1 Tax=Psychrobacter sp. Rd 27.2 TaxID=1926479 RepID=UPI00096981CB
ESEPAGSDGQALIGMNTDPDTGAFIPNLPVFDTSTDQPTMSIKTNDYNSKDMDVEVTLYTKDNDADSSAANPTVEKIDSVNINLTVTPVAGQVAANDVSTDEDTPVTLDEFGFRVLDDK